MLLISVVRKVTIYIMTFLKRFFSGLFARGSGGLCGVIGGCFLLGERGRIGCRGWWTLVFDGVGFLEFFAFSVKRGFYEPKNICKLQACLLRKVPSFLHNLAMKHAQRIGL